jgi:hypothetical protein
MFWIEFDNIYILLIIYQVQKTHIHSGRVAISD